MRHTVIVFALFAAVCADAAAQIAESPFGILRNSITNLHAEGDTLWSGPYLNLTTDGGASFQLAGADSLWGTRNSVYSLDVEDSVIWAGIGYSTQEGDGSVPAVAGYVYSTDGGTSFTYRGPHLDAPDNTSVRYGSSTLPALAVIVPEQSPPYDIDYDPATGDVWIAAWASGIRRSSDQGRTWQRVVLPPDELDYIHPDSSYSFEVAPRRGDSGHFNHMGFSVLVDESGTVWAGTPQGVNRSLDGGLSWRRFSAEGSPSSLTGSWVTSIEEQPLDGRNAVWFASWNAGEVGEQGRYGATVTRNGGETFEQFLLGERVHDFAFRGDRTIYVAAESGLYISEDDGVTWRSVERFRDSNDPTSVVHPEINVYAVATTEDALWVGTSEGLMKSTDGGRTWSVFRTNVPLHPQEPTGDVPDVETYAYPNPFSPQSDRIIRIRYESDGGSDDVLIFDFGMNLVRRLEAAGGDAGEREITWDGTDENGFRVANGVYFYTVDSGGESVRGKIHVLE